MRIEMKIKYVPRIILLSLTSVWLSSCYSGTISDDPEIHQESVNKWLQRTYEDPDDSDALKNLGIFYTQIKERVKGKIYLDRALVLLPDDAALYFYKGMNYELSNENSEAMKYYSYYTNIPENNKYKEMLEGRYLWLQRQNAYSDIKNIINSEKEVAAAITSDSAIAVFPLIYRGINTDYVPLSRGFSEMISIDLAKVSRITVLERIRIQALLDELNFSASGLTEESTTPRAGRILRANTIVSGDFDIKDDQDFFINLGSWETATSQQKIWVNKSGRLNDLFIIQKELVFAFLQKSGIDLTQDEKEQIAYMPTQNLESFIAFSKGLLLEDAGKFREANEYFRRAADIDPKFGAALSKAVSTSAVQNSGGEKTEVLGRMERDDPVTKKEVSNIDADRMQSLGSNLSSGFLPGQNNRNPAQEKSMLEADKLPDPPLPPSR
jgi:tetratricopeptide (TPR) repeat protein